uniref:Maturase n=1 Tax=Cryptoglena skujai TaxID=161229 RepID=A0A0G3SHW8_9EUGL|nr:maturase [Cryptoglena skujai]AKL38993.1 maturase [Cryptoglena skujai]
MLFMKFRDFITEHFLVYTWNNLKLDLGYTRIFEPISKLWFRKCAFLMNKGSFFYENIIVTPKHSNISIKLLKYKVIESAILNIIKLKLEKTSGFDTQNSIEYVRKLFNNDFYKVLLLNFSLIYNAYLFNLRKNFSFPFKSPKSSSLSFKNFFLKKFLTSRNSFFSPNFIIYGTSVHYQLKSLKLWNNPIHFILKCKLLPDIACVNKFFLKNIFLKIFDDVDLWFEIEKMMDSNLIGFTNEFIYRSKINLKLIFISRFLLNLYLRELDFFVKKLSDDLISSISLHNDSAQGVNYNVLSYLISKYIPLKFMRYVKYFSNTKFYNFSRFENVKSFLFSKQHIFQAKFFYRRFFYVRFLDHFLVGIFGASFLAKLVNTKISDFVKSNIRFRFDSLELFKHDETEFFFLGFSLKFFNSINKQLMTFNLERNSHYYSKIITRIRLRKMKISNFLKSHINSELISHLIKVMCLKKLDFNFFKLRFLWIYIFQLESIRSIQSNSLLALEKKRVLLSDDIFSSLKYNNLKFYSYMNYSFDLYLRKLEITLKKVSLDFSSLLYDPINAFDFPLNNLIYEITKGLYFLKEKFYSDSLALDYKQKSQILINSGSIKVNNCFYNVKIFAPFLFLLRKFRILGFIHPFKNNPIGNSKYFIFEDNFIIKEFNYLLLCFLTWYRCSDNFSKVKLFAEYLRESCLLTLCRKHNKSKVWVYSVYTSDFILFRNFSFNKISFPSKLNIINLQKKYLFSYSVHHFNEQLFLVD